MAKSLKPKPGDTLRVRLTSDGESAHVPIPRLSGRTQRVATGLYTVVESGRFAPVALSSATITDAAAEWLVTQGVAAVVSSPPAVAGEAEAGDTEAEVDAPPAESPDPPSPAESGGAA